MSPNDGGAQRPPEWDGLPLSGHGEIALVILPTGPRSARDFPSPKMGSARGDGVAHLVRVSHLPLFLEVHEKHRIVCERAGLLHGMLAHYFRGTKNYSSIDRLFGLSESGRLLDVVLLDQLLALAEDGVEKNPSSLVEIARTNLVLTQLEATELDTAIRKIDGKSLLTGRDLEDTALILVNGFDRRLM